VQNWFFGVLFAWLVLLTVLACSMQPF